MTAARAAQDKAPDALSRLLAEAGIEAAWGLRTAPRAPGALKADGSPVTPADLAADRTIRAALSRLCPELPVLSEEGEDALPSDRCDYACIDPLDGTREFLAGSSEFAVNLALVRDGRPVLGVVVAPAWGLVWAGGPAGVHVARFADARSAPNEAAPGDEPTHVQVSALVWREVSPTRPEGSEDEVRVAVSRRHGDEATDAFVASLVSSRRLEIGSALKFCRVAEGGADLYPRFGPTMPWDTAAGQAIVEAAGGVVLDLEGQALTYGATPVPNPPFLTLGPRALARRDEWLNAARAVLKAV